MFAPAKGVEPCAPSEFLGENHKRFGKGSVPFQIIEQFAQRMVESGTWLRDSPMVVRVRVPTPDGDFLGERNSVTEALRDASWLRLLWFMERINEILSIRMAGRGRCSLMKIPPTFVGIARMPGFGLKVLRWLMPPSMKKVNPAPCPGCSA
jgi:hypothetical protein